MRKSKRLLEKNAKGLNKSNHPLVKNLLSGNENENLENFSSNECRQVFSGKFGEVRITKVSTPKFSVLKSKISSPLLSLTTPRGSAEKPKERISCRPTPIMFNLPRKIEESPFIAVKKQQIRNPKDIHDITYHEVIIHKTLNNVANICPGFTRLFKWFKTQDQYDNSKVYMNYVMEQGGYSLKNYLRINKNVITLSMFKSILFQLFFTLYIGQKECRFVHHDLHNDNILIKWLKSNVRGAFHLYNDSFYCRNILIKITDFGHSRVCLNSKIMYNQKQPISQIFNASIDIKKIKQNFRKVKLSESTYHQNNLKKKLFSEIERIRSTKDVYEKILKHDFFRDMKNKPLGGYCFWDFGEVPQEKKMMKDFGKEKRKIGKRKEYKGKNKVENEFREVKKRKF